MKKIAALAATVLSMALLSITPAQAAPGDLLGASGGSCETSGGSDPADLVNLRVYEEANGVLLVLANFEDDNRRRWKWKLFHNGDVSARGNFDKDTSGPYNYGTTGVNIVVKEVADLAGEDTLRYRFENGSGTVVCTTRISQRFTR